MSYRSGTPFAALTLSVGPFAANALGFAAGIPWLLPILGAAVAFPVFLDRIRRGLFGAAWGWMLFWTIFQSVAVIALIAWFPARGATVIHNGPEYASEMMHWVRTGEGAESTPALFLPVHALHFAGFCALTVLTIGAAGLALGTWLLNYMNYYVVTVTQESTNSLTAALMGWHPWAVIRVVGYIATAVALAALSLRLLDRFGARKPLRNVPTRILLAGVALVVVDMLIKALLAPLWQQWLYAAYSGPGL